MFVFLGGRDTPNSKLSLWQAIGLGLFGPKLGPETTRFGYDSGRACSIRKKSLLKRSLACCIAVGRVSFPLAG